MSNLRPVYAQLSAHSSRVYPATRASRCILAQRRYASTNKKKVVSSKDDEPDDFRAQLYASTFARVQKEKEEQQRFSEMREARRNPSNGMALAAIIFGIYTSLTVE
jgi:hypothetical protein